MKTRTPKDSFDPSLAQSNGLACDRFPETEDEADIAEDILAKELEKLSLDEHEKILFDVHGIARYYDEDPAKVERCLEDLEKELEEIKEKQAYLEAKATNSNYVTSQPFRLMFLRSERFDPRAAAESIVYHFSIKKRLFGGGAIQGRNVRMDDLDKETIEALESGFAQVLPKKDATGRTVVAVCPKFCPKHTSNGLASPLNKAVWYLDMEIAKDEEAQIKGTVMVMYNYEGFIARIDLKRNVHAVRNAMPLRVDAVHYCYSSILLRPLVAGMRLFIDAESRFRVRPHYGSPEANEFELQTFGIPAEVSPISHDGTWSTKRHLELLTTLRIRDENVRKNLLQEPTTCIPRKFDVLFGKSRGIREHTGNLRAIHLCNMYWETYEKASKYKKTEIAENIVSIIQESNGRFLKADNDGVWAEVTDGIAREKISHFFRNLRFRAVSRRTSTVSTSDESASTPSLAAEESESLGMSGSSRSNSKRFAPDDQPLAKRVPNASTSPSLEESTLAL